MVRVPHSGGGPSNTNTAHQRKMGSSKKGSYNGTAPFVLGESLPVIPARLVRKILHGDFVDMAELLHDNMEVERRRSTVEGEDNQGQARGS